MLLDVSVERSDCGETAHQFYGNFLFQYRWTTSLSHVHALWPTPERFACRKAVDLSESIEPRVSHRQQLSYVRPLRARSPKTLARLDDKMNCKSGLAIRDVFVNSFPR